MFGARLCLLLVLVGAVLGSRPGYAADDREDQRVALVIGNANYATGSLGNPVNDARAIGAALEVAGFKVIKLENATLQTMLQGLAQLEREIRLGGIGAFYFAGHGVEVSGENYLIPIDLEMKSAAEIRARGLSTQEVLEHMSRSRGRLNLILLDACRNDPFSRLVRGGRGGLAALRAGAGTFVSFATGPGQFAEDGTGGNSAYSRHLAESIQVQGLGLEDVFKRVRTKVREETENRQVTWDSSSIEGAFYFRPPAAAAGIQHSAIDQTTPTAEPPVTQRQPRTGREELRLHKELERMSRSLSVADMTPGMRFGIDSHAGFLDNRDAYSYPDEELVAYRDLIGKVLVLESIEEFARDGYLHTRFVFNAQGRRYQWIKPSSLRNLKETRYLGVSSNFYSLEDLDRQRSFLVGRTLYTLTHEWRVQRPDGAVKQDAGRAYVPVVVKSVEPNGSFGLRRVTFEDAAGNEGFVVVELFTLLPRDRYSYFSNQLSLADPRAAHPTVSNERWLQMGRGDVALGMSTEEVRLAWGGPTSQYIVADIDGDVMTWRYDHLEVYSWKTIEGSTLGFKGGLLVKVSLVTIPPSVDIGKRKYRGFDPRPIK